jgi:hypothetical protein
MAKIPLSAVECRDKKYYEVETKFQYAGFINIKTEVVYDIVLGILAEEDDVTTVSVDAKTEFEKGEVCSRNAEIIITYHAAYSDKPMTETDTGNNVDSNNDSAGETSPTLKDDEAYVPSGHSYLKGENVDDVVKEFEDAGFTNIKTVPVYNLGTGFWASLSLGDVESVSVDGVSDFGKDAIFKKTGEVVITYRQREIDDPNIQYSRYSVWRLLQDVDDNAMRAKDEHNGEFVEITGSVENISSSGGSFDLFQPDDAWEFRCVTCYTQTDEQEQQVYNMTAGDIITVRGKITSVSDWGYNLHVYSIQ